MMASVFQSCLVLFLIHFAFCEVISIDGTPGMDWIPTPRGMLPSHCVREVPSGSEIFTEENHIRIKHPSGEEELFPKCNYKINETAIENGWVAYASQTGQNFNSFTGSWDVPANPIGFAGETNFFFIALEASGMIIQPVLQWGPSQAGGGGIWGIASWYVVGSTAVYSNIEYCYTGDTVNGTMEMSSQGAWTIEISVNGGSPTSIFPTGVPVQTFATVTLEAYKIYVCEDYPPDNQIKFSNLQLHEEGQPIRPDWDTTVRFSGCNQGVDIVSPSEVIITY